MSHGVVSLGPQRYGWRARACLCDLHVMDNTTTRLLRHHLTTLAANDGGPAPSGPKINPSPGGRKAQVLPPPPPPLFEVGVGGQQICAH